MINTEFGYSTKRLTCYQFIRNTMKSVVDINFDHHPFPNTTLSMNAIRNQLEGLGHYCWLKNFWDIIVALGTSIVSCSTFEILLQREWQQILFVAKIIIIKTKI